MTTGQAISEKELAGFENLLALVPIEQLDITPYSKRYLQHIVSHKKYYCHMYAQVLNLAVQNSGKTKHTLCLVDYGAGNGIMGLLAKYCGFGKVFINDLNHDILDAAKKISQAINIYPDGFIQGDIGQVKNFFTNETLDSIVGTDVIEHIYNLEHFFNTVKEINPAMVTVMSTACNPANYFKVKQFKKLQIKDELYGGTPADHALFGETAIPPFIETRKKIIAAYATEKLKEEEISTLARNTRGLRKDDIEKAVDKYLDDKTLSNVLGHPTNTCDPVTGSWSERILGFDEYTTICSASGFAVQFYDGYYNAFESTLKSRILYVANLLIPFVFHRLSPFIIIVSRKFN